MGWGFGGEKGVMLFYLGNMKFLNVDKMQSIKEFGYHYEGRLMKQVF